MSSFRKTSSTVYPKLDSFPRRRALTVMPRQSSGALGARENSNFIGRENIDSIFPRSYSVSSRKEVTAPWQ
jgi:hypothetical protein